MGHFPRSARRVPNRLAPLDLAAIGSAPRTDRQPDAVLNELHQHLADAAACRERVEDPPDHALHLLVGIEHHLARRTSHVADRRQREQLAAGRLVPLPLIESVPHDVQLGLRHHAAQAQHHPVRVLTRIVQSVIIGDQDPEDGSEFQQLIPVLAGAGQPARLGAEDQPDVVEPDFGQEPLEAGAVGGRAAAEAEVVVDDQDAVRPPAQGHGAIGELVLAVGGFPVIEDLLGRGLAHVDHSEAVEVVRLNLARGGSGKWSRRDGNAISRAHDWPPAVDRGAAVGR
jgi:hypothetical protein